MFFFFFICSFFWLFSEERSSLSSSNYFLFSDSRLDFKCAHFGCYMKWGGRMEVTYVEVLKERKECLNVLILNLNLPVFDVLY